MRCIKYPSIKNKYTQTKILQKVPIGDGRQKKNQHTLYYLFNINGNENENE